MSQGQTSGVESENQALSTNWGLRRQPFSGTVRVTINHSVSFLVNFLRLSFLPVSFDFGLLILRLVSGGAMFWLHGKDKFAAWSKLKLEFSDIIINREVSLGLTIFAELVCAGLLILGLFGRFAALILAITMGVAFFKVHSMKLTGDRSGELALLYLMAYVALVLAGPGKFSVDGSSAAK